MAGNLRRVYESVSSALKTLAREYEIIIVDDGSTDQTFQIAEAIADADARVKVVHHPQNLGYGVALRSGIQAAAKQLVFFTDDDGQFSPDELPLKSLPRV